MKRKVDVSILGQRFSVKSDKDDAYVHALSNFVTRKFEELQRQTRSRSTHDLALLVALNIADELFQAEERAARSRQEIRKHSERVLANVNAALAKVEVDRSAPLDEDTAPSRQLEMPALATADAPNA